MRAEHQNGNCVSSGPGIQGLEELLRQEYIPLVFGTYLLGLLGLPHY